MASSIVHLRYPPSSSSSSDEASSTPEKTTNCATKFISNCLTLSSAFLQTPFHPPSFPHSSKPNANILLIRDLHDSLISTADRCLRALNSAAAENPLLKKFFSMSDNFRTFCQIRSRSYPSSNSLSTHNFAAILPGDSVAGLVVANGLSNFLNLYNTLLVVRLVLTWFPNAPPAIVSPLSTICDPYLNIFRGLIPPLGGTLDLSPILAFLVLNSFTSASAALPAELPTAGASKDISSSDQNFLNLTTTQKKWMKRVLGNRSSKNSGSLNS